MPLPVKGQQSWADPLNQYLAGAASDAAAEATQAAVLAKVQAETAREAAEAARDQTVQISGLETVEQAIVVVLEDPASDFVIDGGAP